MLANGRLVRRVVFPVTVIITTGLLSVLTALTAKDALVDDTNIPNFDTYSTSAAVFCGASLFSTVTLSVLRYTYSKQSRLVGSILPLTGALIGIVEAILTINLVAIEKLNPLQFDTSLASSISIPTRIAVWTLTNTSQLVFFIILVLLNRADRPVAIPRARRRRSSMPTDSQGSQSIPMLTEKSSRPTPARPKTPPTPHRLRSPSYPPSLPPISINEKFSLTVPAPVALTPPVPVPSPPSPSKRNSWLQQVQQAVRPTNSRRGVASALNPQHVTQTARSSTSQDSQSIDTKSFSNSFDEYWDNQNQPEAQIKDILMLSSPGSLAALRGQTPVSTNSGVLGTTLETIPGSRPSSPAKTLQGLIATQKSEDTENENSPALQSSSSSISTLTSETFFSTARPATRRSIPACSTAQTSRPPTAYSTTSTTTITTGNRRYSSSRPATPSSTFSSQQTAVQHAQYRPTSPLPPPGEAHIHPLFRSDSPTPPPITSPNTVVVASPFSGQVIGQISPSNQGLSSRPSVNSFRSHSVLGATRKMESSQSLRKASGRASPAPSSGSTTPKPSLASIAADLEDEISTSWVARLSQVPATFSENSAPSSGQATPQPAVPSRAVSRTSLARTASNGPIPQFILDANRERLI